VDEESVNDGDGRTLTLLPPPPPPPPPPNMPNAARFWATTTQFMTIMMANMPRQRDRDETVGCSLENFFKHNSPMFDGSKDPWWLTTGSLISKTLLRCSGALTDKMSIMRG
jgi:hypothetical protein